ncbi:MAG: hypothetical protein K6F28_00150 [Lachnospiraceae bacterium]|nr:hypothetical protein [Lachnospiraceae bacterium]
MKRDNKGSTLITVIVAIAFVTILTSIILGTTVTSMAMKGIDRKVKDDFYYAEKGLNDVYTGIGQNAAEIAGKKYDSTILQIGKTFATAEEANREFKKGFLKSCFEGEVIDQSISAPLTDPDDIKSKLDPFIVAPFSSRISSVSIISVGTPQYKKKDGTYTTTAYTDATLRDYVGVVIPNVSVSAKDTNDYQSIVTADIVIECPTVDFLDTNAEITDYAIIGCQGVYFTSDASGNKSVNVSGNLYGGVHSTPVTNDNLIYPTPTPVVAPLYGGINVYGCDVTLKSNYVVSKGDINVAGNNPSLTIENANTSSGIPSVWFDSMRTVKGANNPKITINNANMFALNDLELNADNSNVKLMGDYYGYNDKTIASGGTEETLTHGDSLSWTADRNDADSSAMMINGRKCTLDMSNLHSLVLMGKAFIDFSSKGAVPTGYPKIAASAESTALQTNQQLYVVPTDFMTGPNPATDENYPAGGFQLNKKRSELDDEHNGWFGYKYVKQSNGPADEIVNDIFEEYVVTIDGEKVHYAYLKFNDDLWIKNDSGKYVIAKDEFDNPITKVGTLGSVSSKAAFFDEIMSSTGDTPTELQPSAYRLKRKVLDSVTYEHYFDLQKSVINEDSSAVIYGRNAIVNYDVEHGRYFIKGNTEGLERFADYPENLFNRYQMMCVFLDGKEDYKLSDSITFNTVQTAKIGSDWTRAAVTSPMDNYVLVSSLNPTNTNSGNNMYLEEDASNAAFGACIVAPSYTLASGSKLKGVALIYGDVIIESGAEVDGLLMATGTVTVKGGSSSNPTKISSNKGILQSRVEKELNLVEKGSEYKNNFLISYLTSDGSTRMYSVTPGGAKDKDRIKPDYNSFMHYENWKKGN